MLEEEISRICVSFVLAGCPRWIKEGSLVAVRISGSDGLDRLEGLRDGRDG
jgi:hypothetical protein